MTSKIAKTKRAATKSSSTLSKKSEPSPVVSRHLANCVDAAELEIELVEALRKMAQDGKADAAKFLLVNLWPERWSVNPNPGKPSPLSSDAQPASATPAPPQRDEPFRMKLFA